ncbi:hypothetical protein [Brenneria tiliae]|uniref:hypothetical protein n=1 Tax=Brenneria tiliae TaxID=2914984 RepID=UPI00201501A6|nr:hypothetical protein [Brenneria tiliae]MCL2897131.1 hypothetical protein [Brenneria tiliae]MCL2904784.1 hypothetical protein [Brenneria tiliae]
MKSHNILFSSKNKMSNWVTIREAVKIMRERINIDITDSDIYRNALDGNIFLSIYFQSPVILKKLKTSAHKVKLRPTGKSLINRLCQLDKNCFLCGRNLIVSTKDGYIIPTQRIIDTALIGYEYVIVQQLLARSLNIPLPIMGANEINYGISVTLSREIFQVFEKVTWQERIKQQIMRLPENIALDINERISSHPQRISRGCHSEYFPVHDLPQDACFVIRYAELEKLINMPVKNEISPVASTPTRISTPLSRLFWLSCKHNETIRPLINQPYKLLSIFEQWASSDGITDRLNGDTLKTALERGSPQTSSFRISTSR